MSKNTCTKCGGTYEKQEDERVCMQCGNRPDNKPFPDIVEKIAQAKARGPYEPGRPIDLTEEEKVAIVNEGKERGWVLVARENRITPNTIYNWRNNLEKYRVTSIRGLRYEQLGAFGPHPLIVNLLKELPALDSKPSQASLDGFTRAFGGILMIIYLKED